MDFGAGRMEYRFGDGSQNASGLDQRGDPRLAAAIHAGFLQSRSVVLHRFGTDPTYNAWRESVPGQHGTTLVRSSQRNPPPLFGAGRIDTIPDEAIEAAARRRSSTSAHVKGRVSRLKDGRIGRFGWKAQTATLEEFILSAAAGEMGLEIPGRHQAADPRLPGLAARGLDMDQDDCNLLIDYVRGLRPPVVSPPADDRTAAQIKAGEATFKSIGCASCHLSKLGDVEGIFTDLLLHDMGQQLSDADTYTVFTGEPPRRRRPRAHRARPHSYRYRPRHGPRVAHTPALGPARFRPVSARRPRRRNRGSYHHARRPGRSSRAAVRRACPQAQTTSRGIPHVARPSFSRLMQTFR